MLELCLIFLGKTPPNGVSFKKPGAVHKARWLNKIIYAFKIYLFKSQFKLSKLHMQALKRFCNFLVNGYVKAWHTAPLAVSAPNNDFEYLKLLTSRKGVLWEKAALKLAKHLWYLSPELMGLAFFDNNVSVELKRLMVQALNKYPEDAVSRNTLNLAEISKLTLADFISSETRNFFTRLNINTSFLTDDPAEWCANKKYLLGKRKAQSIAVVNDNAERSVALMTEFNGKITRNEQQVQYLLQVVEEHRKTHPLVETRILL